MQSRLSYYRKPCGISPILQKLPSQTSWHQILNTDSPPLNSEECSKNDYGETSAQVELPLDDGEEISQFEQNQSERIIGSPKKKRRNWYTLKENVNQNEIVERLRKTSAKGHKCTKCDHFRLAKYFNDTKYMVCNSCHDICFICSLLIVPQPLKKARHPVCHSCKELKETMKKKKQRLSMQALRL